MNRKRADGVVRSFQDQDVQSVVAKLKAAFVKSHLLRGAIEPNSIHRKKEIAFLIPLCNYFETSVPL